MCHGNLTSVLTTNIQTRDNRRPKVHNILNLITIIQTTHINLLLLGLILLLLLLLLEVFRILKLSIISEERHLKIILINLEIIMRDLIIWNTENLNILYLLLTLIIILKPLWFPNFLHSDLQDLDDCLILQIRQFDNLHWLTSELLNGHELFILFPSNLQSRGEILVQVPDVHVHGRKGTLDFGLGIRVVPSVLVYIQFSDLAGEIYE